MRILVTGREGQVARSLAERGPEHGHEVVALGRPVLDLACDADSIVAAIETVRPDVVVSAAAYTAVDKAESEPELAYAINESGVAAVARAARKLDVPLIHLSTDYVFDGSKTSPYVEKDSTNPGTVYGASKLAGEKAVLAEHSNSVILRTAWVFSPFATNFVKTMLRLARDRDELPVVADQHGNPTSALDIAGAILAIASNLHADSDENKRGLFHMSASGEASWAEFAEAIFEASASMDGPSASVKAITTADYPTAAKRPANSRLDCSKLARIHGIRLPQWRGSLSGVVSRLASANCMTSGVVAFEGHYFGGWEWHPALSGHPRCLEAAASGVRQTADLLPANDPDACGHSRRAGDHDTARLTGIPAFARRRLAMGDAYLLRSPARAEGACPSIHDRR